MNPEKFRFSEQQLQKLRGTHRRLRRLNRTVLMHLRQIWPHFRDQQYRDAGRLLGLEASQINSLLEVNRAPNTSGKENGGEERPEARVFL
jgi:hypothetical protein